MKPLVIYEDKLYAGAGISEIYFSPLEKTYAFYSLSSNQLNQYIILRYKSISKKVQGPYTLDKSFEFTLPMWINQNPDAYQVYALRIHPDFRDRVSDPDNTECVLSYIANPSAPVYIGNVCNTESAYLNYYPQFLQIKKK
jgi:hypothetical protein